MSGQSFELNFREALEARESMVLSPAAAKAKDSLGRLHPIELDDMRTNFQRDRDRILHSKSFRRLSHKTQVFLAPEGDHYRTRLTHTLEVSQIARSITRALGLNEDLTEAIAYGHDLGHTPFGHTGESALSRALARHRGIDPDYNETGLLYKHNLQSVRIVEKLENNGKGLNLSREVVDGIKHHNGKVRPQTYEGKIVAISDRIAYVCHDIDDAIRAKLLTEDDLPKSTHAILGLNSSERISRMVHDTIQTSYERNDIYMSERVWSALLELREFLFNKVYTSSDAKREEPKAQRMIGQLFDHYINHFDEVPEDYKIHSSDDTSIQVVDYIAGMTDRYAISKYQELFIPRAWRLK
ncbi:MAG: deoxyguanosinetriphosphate triphosphohydrolase [Coriobacteriia bacterium]|nr:deoxyguanosinetriphosphate triphosphohydrolase [Coriobacteriia bacterium]